MKKSIWIVLTLLLAAFLLAACTPQAPALEGADRDAVLVYAEPAADAILGSLSSGVYADFSSNFNAAMLTALPETAFAKLRGQLTNPLGAYQSRTISRVEKATENKQDFYAVIYACKFEKGSISMRLVFDAAEPHKVSGLFFK